jgi:hypothetical protein
MINFLLSLVSKPCLWGGMVLMAIGEAIDNKRCRNNGAHHIQNICDTIDSCEVCGKIWMNGKPIDPKDPSL